MGQYRASGETGQSPTLGWHRICMLSEAIISNNLLRESFMIRAGFSISFGLDELADQQHSNPEKPLEVPVQEVREPPIDILEEAGFTLILAELPGITKKDIKLTLNDDLLTISAARGGRRYYKEVLLSGPHSRNQLRFSCNNGILEIRAYQP
jgi:HSP20 family molecular chaperone IbpA